MKKLLLIALVASGLAFVPVQRSDAQVSVGIGVGYRGYYGYYPYGYYGLTIGTAGTAITATTVIITTIGTKMT
jgi:hypothetical protein